MEMPKKYQDLVGTKQTLAGYVFNKKDQLEETEFDVLNIRFGSSFIMDMENMEIKHPTFQLLLKNGSMRKAQWTNVMPMREIDLESEEAQS